MDGVFQELVLAGLLLLIVLVAVATLVIVRRSRHSGTPGATVVRHDSVDRGDEEVRLRRSAPRVADPLLPQRGQRSQVHRRRI